MQENKLRNKIKQRDKKYAKLYWRFKDLQFKFNELKKETNKEKQ